MLLQPFKVAAIIPLIIRVECREAKWFAALHSSSSWMNLKVAVARESSEY